MLTHSAAAMSAFAVSDKGSPTVQRSSGYASFLCRYRGCLTVFEFTLDFLLEGMDRARG